ncbi:MAG TPA: DUF4124 domain-containing protein [Gammaproteobacteria bacterium]|nr:DUF4124 domain-containing protein [Gammaproteobacteria bacterium]
MRIPLFTIPVMVFALVLAGAADAGTAPKKGGKLYKWVDENGVVHYGDKIPPEYAKQEREVLTEQGIKVDTLEAQKTPEQLAAEAAERERQEQERKAAEERAAHDRMLLATYTSVADLERARDRRIQDLEAQVRVTSGTIANLETQLAELEKQRKTFVASGREVPAQLDQDIEHARADLLRNQQFLIAKQQEIEKTRRTFADDIARFKELRGITP